MPELERDAIFNSPLRDLMKMPGLGLAIAAVTLISVVLCNTFAQAGLLETHSQVFATAGDFPPIPLVMHTTDGPNDTGSVFKDDSLYDIPRDATYRIDATARAATSLAGPSLLRALATSYSENVYSDPEGRAAAQATWRDIAFIGGTGTPPGSIRLNFAVGASITGVGWGSSASLSVHASGNATSFTNGFQQLGTIQRLGPGYDNSEPREPFFEYSGFDGYTNQDGAFAGTFHVDVPYNATLGGYLWGVSISVRADALGSHVTQSPSSATANALNTLGLVNVTDANGSPLEVSFDSGLRLVPEPCSAGLLAIAALHLVRFRLRRA